MSPHSVASCSIILVCMYSYMQSGDEYVDRRNLMLLSAVFPLTNYGILILKDVDWPDMSYYWHQNSLHMQRHSTLLTTDCIGGIWATTSNIKPDVKGKKIIKQVSFDSPLCWWFRWMTSRNGLDCSVKECGILQSATEGLGLYLLFHHSWRCANESPDPKAQSTSLPPFKVAWVGKKT